MTSRSRSEPPLVDLVIAVHRPGRPVDRAVASVLRGTQAPVRVTVVCHNTPEDGIAARLGDLASDHRVRLLSLDDGIRSPAGPFNAGLEAATGTYTSIMGSDDTLEAGAVDSWLRLARRSGSDAVIARLRHDRGPQVATPPTRPGRRTRLDGVRDRLSYRSAPLGLVARRPLGTLRFAAGLPVGEDVSYASRLWFSGKRIAFDRSGPAYVVGADADDRVTLAPRSVQDELAYLPAMLESPWFARLTAAQRHALVMKFLRIHVFGAVSNRPDPAWWTPRERGTLQQVTADVIAASPRARRTVSRADQRLLAAITDTAVRAEDLLVAARDRRRFGRPGTVLPADLRQVLAREAPLRMMAASWLVSHGW